MRHFCVVKLILCFPLVCALGLWADEAQTHADIDKVITDLNDPVQRVGLFTKDADSQVDFDHLVDLHRKGSLSTGVAIGMNETWTEMTVPRVLSGRIRLITPDVAIVDAASTIRGAVTLTPSVPLLVVMKKEGGQWRIAAVRACTPAHVGTPDSRNRPINQ